MIIVPGGKLYGNALDLFSVKRHQGECPLDELLLLLGGVDSFYGHAPDHQIDSLWILIAREHRQRRYRCGIDSGSRFVQQYDALGHAFGQHLAWCAEVNAQTPPRGTLDR